MTEYYLGFWGGAEETIEKELGIKERNFWFKTAEEKEKFKESLRRFSDLGLMFHEEEGELNHKRTVAIVKLKYKEKIYKFEYDFGYEYPESGVLFMFEEGNYSCDCNKSLFIKQHCDKNFKELVCGDKIELVSLKTKYVK